MSMSRNPTLGVLFTALAPLAGCTVSADDPSEASNEDDLSAASRSYVTVTHDNRKCMSPVCGGYWVKDVNRKTAATYVSDLDFALSGLDAAALVDAQGAPAEELVLRGKLGPKEAAHGTRPFLVSEVYRGMPGVVAVAGEAFYQAKPRSPQISCFAAPCPNETATKLNATEKTYFSGYTVDRAKKPFVDAAWLIERVEHGGAVVAGRFSDGQSYPGGVEQLLDASQVFVRLPADPGPCPVFKLAACPKGQSWTYTRDANLCLLPDTCAADAGCPSLQPAQCAEGYDLASWRTHTKSCRAFACDPAFVVAVE